MQHMSKLNTCQMCAIFGSIWTYLCKQLFLLMQWNRAPKDNDN
jgi:hypothetical protein